MLDVADRLQVFRELLESVNPNLVLVELDSHYDLIRSNTPDFGLWGLFFDLGRERQNIQPVSEIYEEFHQEKAPYIFTNKLGMAWMSESLVVDGKIERIVNFGPVFLDDYSSKRLEGRVRSLGLSFALVEPFMETIRRMPVISLNRLHEYGIMLHRCLTGEVIGTSDFIYPELAVSDEPEEQAQQHLGSYMAETEILRIVEEGNIHYAKEKKNAFSLTGDTSRPIGGETDFLRQAKNTVIIFTTLCSRAAIRGGLAPEVAYHLSDQYVSMIERAENLAKVNEINRVMFDEYVRRVYRNKTAGSGMSPQMIETCNYISLHLTGRIDIHHLASRLDYADYYFSTKFKKEVGMSVRDFIMEQKLQKAQEMLRDSSLEISEVADRLGFETQSHFSDVFRKKTGLSPSKWRAAAKKQ